MRHSSSGLDAIIQRRRPSWFERFCRQPFKTLARTLYALRHVQWPTSGEPPCEIICISDTHNSQPVVPNGDILIHAGDMTQSGTFEEIQITLDWLNSLPHQHKVVIAGNHDTLLEVKSDNIIDQRRLEWGSVIYLQDSDTTLKCANGRLFKIFGSPWSRKHGNWAFQYPKGTDKYSGTVPNDVDILVTHEPPKFHLDLDSFGDAALLREVQRVGPKLHVFGHIHEGYGIDALADDDFEYHYESVCAGREGISALVKMGLILLAEKLFWQHIAAHTILVNACAVGGLLDDRRRDPVRIML